ncbi:MAG TPA: permease, partial [Bryobacteraceae bacterium]|nr:permease [Bryobacteraceae bacterium]
NVLLLAMKDSMRLAIVGIAVGLVGGQWLIQALASQLFEISATDPATYSAVVAVLLLSVAAASYLPARRATLVDPTTALRHD